MFHVFLLLGQSNMAGYPKAVAADKAEHLPSAARKSKPS
jgi:hypothetical protein